MIKKRDMILIGMAALAAGALLWLLPTLRLTPAPHTALYMRYQVEGQEPVTVPLGEDRELTVDQGADISNTFRLFATGFVMESSTCKNQVCVHQGEVTIDNMAERPLYQMIICAPHRLVAELLTAEEVEKTNHAQ